MTGVQTCALPICAVVVVVVVIIVVVVVVVVVVVAAAAAGIAVLGCVVCWCDSLVSLTFPLRC